MKIVVCIKQVPDTTVIKINPVTGTLIRDGVPSIMNPDDKGGLEMALELKDKYGAHVTVITMGPPQADAILREAYAMGVDKAILLTGREFGGADTLATSHTIAAALKNLEYDLIIAGRQAIDGDTAQVGPQIAEHLGLPQISYVVGFDVKDGKYVVKKETEEGYQMLEVAGPALMTVLASGFKARYMTVSGIVDAFDKPVEVWGVEKVNLPVEMLGLKGSGTKVYKSFTKGVKAAGEVHEVDAEQAVGLIVSKLKEKFII
ncbi:MAG: electron transfer flavoprotein subunit beta/FixA family protein [Bacteroidales bacterium]|nr:electron transfer flavoprotein subunit beta/FixA family protein [Bacteroidales bacterium]